MGLLLNNARLTVNAGKSYSPPVQKIKPARTSIAEDAVFIPKPHKRVDFKLQSGAPGETGAGGAGGGENVSLKPLGSHGVTAEFGSNAQLANGAPKVVMEVIANPQKDFSVISTQEEGRQSHNASTVNFTQAYDAYGRPRIGFSREPYDFAFTKWMIKTSQLKFQQNVAESQAQFDKYAFDPKSLTDPNAQKVQDAEQALATGTVEKGMVTPDPQKLVNGNAVGETKTVGASPEEAAKMMGIDAQSVMVPNAVKKDGKESQKDGGQEPSELTKDIFKPLDQLGGSKAKKELYADPGKLPESGTISVSA
ncbi:MAG: hypothetical protein HZA04_01275 [Nitrospinae bacterium]|nr:hypothetical protein [Nitrospinota bacterium]